jgi:hypothetical protein
MAVRSRLLVATRSVAPGVYTTLLTVPADRVAVIRRFGFVNRASAARAVRVAVWSAGVIVDVWTHTGIPAEASAGPEDTNLILNPGDDLLVWSAATPANDLLHFYAGGSLLAGPPA